MLKNYQRRLLRNNYARSAVCCCLFFLFSAQGLAVSKCVAADGSVSYVQGNCPQLNQKRAVVRVWDSGRGMQIGPDHANDPKAGQRSVQPDSLSPGRPCNASSQNPVQRRLENLACSVLSRPHDSDNPACRTLATGSWKHQEGLSVPEYKALIAQCESTGSSPNSVGSTSHTETYQGAGVPRKRQDCFEAKIVEPIPFLGNSGEVFQLSDGSVWQVTNGYLYRKRSFHDVVDLLHVTERP